MNKNGCRQGDYSPWLDWGMKELAFLGEREARQECEEILTALLGLSRFELYLATEIDQDTLGRFRGWIEARKNRIPLAHLSRRAYFWEDEFEAEEGVFIPRPETEILIESFLNSGLFDKRASFRFLDLGTGTGIIAVTVAKHFPNSEGIAVDKSAQALAVCGRNAIRLGVRNRVGLVHADGLSGFENEIFDVVLSNPPYVAIEDWPELQPEVLREPHLALEGGEDGLGSYKKISEEIFCLKANGSLWLEIGWNQANAVKSIFKKKFQELRIFKDFNQIDRVIGGIGFHG